MAISIKLDALVTLADGSTFHLMQDDGGYLILEIVSGGGKSQSKISKLEASDLQQLFDAGVRLKRVEKN